MKGERKCGGGARLKKMAKRGDVLKSREIFEVQVSPAAHAAKTVRQQAAIRNPEGQEKADK